MYRKAARIFAVTTLAVASLFGQEAKKKEWKDRGEYDMYEAITKEAAPAKKLELLNGWKEKYPNTDYGKERQLLYINTYAALGKYDDLLNVANQILASDPQDLTSLYWVTEMTPKLGKTDAALLDNGEKVANSLLASLDELFSDARKPGPMSKEQWDTAKKDMQKRALRCLAWVQMQKKAWDAAEKTVTTLLGVNPADAEASYWMYTIIRSGGKPERRSTAFWHLARSASLTGTGAWPDAQRKQVDEFFVKAYNAYHGPDEQGLAELRKAALASPMPPDGFYIKTATEIATEKENEFKKSNPQLAFWLGIRKELAGENGAAFFETMKGAHIPGTIDGADGVKYTKLKGKLISHKPAVNPKELVLGLEDATNADVTLKLETPLRGRADPGTEIQFEGVAQAFTKDPFNLVFEVEPDKIIGWPAQSAAPAVKKAAPAAKKAVGKKK